MLVVTVPSRHGHSHILPEVVPGPKMWGPGVTGSHRVLLYQNPLRTMLRSEGELPLPQSLSVGTSRDHVPLLAEQLWDLAAIFELKTLIYIYPTLVNP